MRINIKTMLSRLKDKQIPTDKNKLDRAKSGLQLQPFSKEAVKAHYEQMKLMQVPMLENEQYVLITATAKYLINANGDMFLVEGKRK